MHIFYKPRLAVPHGLFSLHIVNFRQCLYKRYNTFLSEGREFGPIARTCFQGKVLLNDNEWEEMLDPCFAKLKPVFYISKIAVALNACRNITNP